MIKGSHSTNPWLTATIEGGGIDVAADVANAGIYEVVKVNDELNLKVYGQDLYIGTTSKGQISLVSVANETILENAGDNKTYIKNGGRYLYNNQSDYTREAGNLTATGNAEHPKWGFVECYATPLTGKFYTIKGEGELPWLTANATAAGNVKVSANENAAGVFYKTANGIQAVATGKYLGYTGGKYTYSDTELGIELRNTGEYLANYSNKYAIVSGGNYMFNNNNDGIVHESSQQLAGLPRLWAFTEVAAPAATVNGVIYETLAAAANAVEAGQTLTLWKNTDETFVLPMGVTLNKNGFTADNVTVALPVAKIGDTEYATLEEAAAAAQVGDEIKLLANIDGAITLPANVVFNGNGYAVSGGILAEGDITFAGVTKAADFDANVSNTVVNIPVGASLQLTGTDRLVIGHGATFNITGSIEDAKTADKATLTPSLIMPGASFTGAGVTFNVSNAYIKTTASYCSSSKNANGTFDFNINNSIWENVGKLAFEEQSVNAKVDFALVNSVLTTGGHLVFGTASGEEGVVIDNSYVNKDLSRQLENCGTMTIKNGSVVNGAVATSSNAKNPGTVIVENATYAVTGEFSGSDLGTGTLIIKKGATVSAGSITKANITVDAEGMTAADEINLTANLSKLVGELSVINNDKLEAKIVEGKVVLVEKPVAMIGETGYTTLEAAFAAAAENATITLLADVTPALTSQRAITKAAVIDLGGKTLTLKEDDLYFGTTTFKNGTIVVDPSVNASTAVFWMFENQTLTFDNVAIVATGVTGTYLIGINGGTGTAVNLLNGSSITIDNESTAGLTAVICDNGTGNTVTIDKSVIAVKNIEGRFYLGGKNGSVSVKNTTVTLNGVKEGFYLRAGQSLDIAGASKLDITLNSTEGRYGINLTDKTATYTKAATATVNSTLFEYAKGSNSPAYTGKDANGNVRVWGEGGGNAKESFELKLYAGDVLVATSRLNNVGGIIDGDVYVTWNFYYPESNDEYWTTTWEEGHPNSAAQPTKLDLVIDGTVVATTAAQMNAADNLYPVKWEELGGVKYVCTGLNGEGTAASPYLINRVEELKFFRDAVNAGNNYAGKFVKLTASIDLNSEQWLSIGTEANPFKGNFDGNNNTISNLKIVEDEAKEGKVHTGFFGFAKDATITNVTIENVNINIPCLDIDHSQGHIGAIAGSLEGTSTIENVTVKGDIKVYATQDANGASRVAVIAGGNTNGNVTMKNVHVIANEGSYLKANNNAGALAGQLQGKCVFENCSSNIDVTVNKFFAGGLIGIAAGESEFTNCHTTGNVAVVAGRAGRANDHYRVGGIAGGWADGKTKVCTLTNCSYSGEVSGVNADGSVAETLDYDGYVGRGYTLTNCAGSKVVIDGVEHVQVYNDVYGFYQVGDVYEIGTLASLKAFRNKVNAGENYQGKTIVLTADIDLAGDDNWEPIGTSDKTFNGMFDGQNHTISNLTINGSKEYVSGGNNDNYKGLFGYMKGGNTAGIKNLTIQNAKVTGCLYVGAVLGRSYTGGIIENCHVKGLVQIDSYSYAGGVVGRHEYSSDANGVSINNCSVDGTVLVRSTENSFVNADYAVSYVGGIVGFLAEGNFKITGCSAKNIEVSGVYGVGGISGIGHYGNKFEGASVDGVTVTSTNNDKESERTGNVGLIVGATQGTAAEPTIFKDCTAANTTASATYTDGTSAEISAIYGSTMKGQTPATNYVASVAGNQYEALVDAFTAAQEGDEVVILKAGTYALKVKDGITITGAVAGVEFANIGAFGCNGASVTFNNVTFTYAENSTYKGLQHSGNLVYNNCTFNGQVFLYGQSETFNKCTFNTTDSNNYNVWTYGAKEVAFNECTFNSAGKSVLIYAESASVTNDVTVTKCTFKASQAVEGKAAIEMDSSLTGGINLTIDGETTATGFAAGNVSGNSLWNNKKGNETVANNDITVIVGGETVLAPIFEAQIGETKFRKLTDAIAAVQNGETITLLRDITENVTLTEKVGLYYTLDGNGKTLKGSIVVTPLSDTNDNRRITIKNVKFVDETNAEVDFISSAVTNHYPRITVEGCTFTGSGDATDVAIRLKTAYGAVIKGCTATGLHSFLQNTAGLNLTIENVTVKESKSAFALGTVQGVTVKGCDIAAAGYGIRLDAGYNNKAVIESNTVSAFIPVVVRKATVNSNITVQGTNNFTATNTDGIWMAIGASEYETNGALPAEVAAANVVVTLNDADLDYTGIYGAGLAGKGTVDEPYLINNVTELQMFRDKVNSGKDTKFNTPGVWVALGADINMEGVNWVGIGSAAVDHGFMSNFDGNDYKFQNLTITNPALDSDDYAYAGLFAVTEGTDKDNQNTIKNLTIENVTITTTGHIAAAAIAYPYYTIVDNVKVCGNIAIQGGDYTAGVLAYTRRCVNASNLAIVGNEGSFVKGNQVVGGVISDIQMNGGLVADYSNFSAEGVTVSGTKNVGGISGIIATQTLDGATVKNVTLESNDAASAGIVSGALGGTSTISNVTYENVTGATALLGATYDGKAIKAKIGDTYYATLENALAAQGEATVELLVPFVVAADETVELNLNGKTVVATDNATGSYAMITNKGNLTINGEGAIKLTATNDRDWNAYSSVISNTVGGKLTVNGGTIEHLGGTDMAYAIDNLTNGKNTYAETVINGGTIKSTYRAIRQFLNGVEAQNILTVNGGTIEGANKSIWMQDPSANANTGTLTVGNNASLKGDVYLFVTAGSTAWPVEVSIATAALKDGAKVVTGNVPADYAVANVNGVWGVSAAVATVNGVGYAALADAIAAAQAGDVVTVFEGTYAMPSMKAGITIVGEGNVMFEGTLTGTLENLTMKNIHIKGGNAQRWAYAKGNLVFENVTFEATSVYALHFDGIAAGTNLTYKDCTIIGWAALGGSPASCVFDGCTVKGNGSYGVIRTYFDAEIKDCTFDVSNVNTNDVYQDGIHAVEGAEVVVTNCTNANGDMKDLVNVSGTSVVTVDGVEIKNVAKIGDTYYLTVTEAINAAADGATVELLAGTIDEAIAPWAGDSQHRSEKSITIIGAEDFGTTLTGGMFLGYNDGTLRDNTITVKGINFVGKGVVVANQKNVVVEDNKFTNIDALVSEKHGNSNSAILVIGSTKDMSIVATIKNNVIENVTGNKAAGIYLSQAGAVVVEGNTVTGTQHNALTVSASTTSTVDVKNNAFAQWGLCGEGRAVRISGTTVNVNENVMSYEGTAPEEFVKVASATSVNAAENYWNGVRPLNNNVFLSNLESDPALQLVNYYTDAEKQNKVEISASAAKIGDVYYASLVEAIAAAQDGETIVLVADVTMSYGAREAYETATSTVVIDGNGKTLTLNQTNSDWSSFGLANDSKLVLNNMTINKSGKGATSGAWNTHAIIFSCPVEMNEVTVNNSVAVQAGATLNNVAINEANGYYGLWINGNGQTVAVNGGSITATNGGRGIKIADQYITEPAQVTLSVDGTVFNTAKKAAVLVSSTAGAKIAANDVDIANVAEDNVNFVWVDEDWAANYGNVEVTGAPVAQEGAESFTTAITENGAVKSYYKTLAAAVKAAQNGDTVELLVDVTLAGGYEDATEGLRIESEITLDGNGHTIDCGTFQKGVRIYNLNHDGDFKVSFNDVKIVNNVVNGRCIDTRSGDINLTITKSELIAQNGNSQPLTIGGSEAIQRVKLDAATIDAGNSGYGVICFVPVKQNIYAYDETKVSGYAAFYLKDHGNKNIKLSLGKGTYVSKNIHSGESNTFGTIVLEGDNNVLQILGTTPTLKAITEGNASQAVVLIIGANNTVSLESTSAKIEVEGENAYYGMISAENAGTTTINNQGVEMLPVAEVDGFQFLTYKEAYRYAKDGATLKVVNDFVLTETLVNTKNIVLDLNGKTVSMEDASAATVAMIKNEGNLTITDSSDAKDGKLSFKSTTPSTNNGYACNVISNYGTFTMEAGIVENLTVGGACYALDNYVGSTATVNGGKLVAEKTAVRVFNWTNGEANAATLNVNGGEIISNDGYAINVNSNAAHVALNISGGTITTNDTDYNLAVYAYYSVSTENFTANISGGTFNGNFAIYGASMPVGNVSVSGGEFDGVICYGEPSNGFVSGGTFKSAVEAAYCAAGYMPNKNVDGTYGVVAIADAYASIDGVTYGSLAAAIQAAKAGETITLLQNVKENVTISKNLTIDGADNTITGMITTDGKSLKVTIKNAKFDGDNKTINYALRADDDLNLVVENCTASNYIYGFLYANKSNDKIVVKNVTVENCAEYGAYLVSFNKATFENFTVKGATKYGIAVANAGARNVTLKNVSFENAETPLSINEIGTGKVTFTFEGVNEMGKEEIYRSEYVKLVSAAQVGTKVYGSIAEAFAAAQGGDTVKLLSDFNLGLNDVVLNNAGQKVLAYVADKNITLDMNGKKIAVEHRSVEAADRIYAVICVEDGAGLTVTGEGSIDVTTGITDANVMPKVAYMFWKRGTTGYLVIENGNFHMDNSEDSMVYTNGDNIVTVNGGTFILDANGTRVNGFPWIFNVAGNNAGSINVTGGTYNYDIRKQAWSLEVKLAEGLTTTNNGDGTWTVVPAVAAIVDGESYGSIQEAIDAAQDGQTVQLLADVAYTDADAFGVEEKPYSTMLYVQGKNITLDMNGKKIDVTYTGSLLYSVVLVSDGAGLTVTGEGAINAVGCNADGTAAKNIAYMFWKRGTTGYLVIENGSFYMNDAADSMVYTNGDEIVTVNGGTFTLTAVASQANGWPVIFSTQGNNEKQIVVNGGTFNYDINHQMRPFEVYVAPEKAVKKVDDMWTIVPAQAYITEKLGDWVNEAGAYEHKVGYATVAEAFAATNDLGNVVTILAGEYTGNLNVNKGITVQGETDEEGNNLVTFNGKLSITADGATVKNINFNNSGTAAYVGAKDVTIDGCSLVGSNGLYQSYTSGTVTFKNSYIKGGTYGIHFDGNAGGNIVIDNCTVIGWTSFAGTITNVAISGTTFAKGNYNQLRLYQNATITDCVFNEKMNIDWGSSNKTAEFTNCSVEGDKDLTEIISLANIATKGLEVTVDGELICVAAKVDNKYYLSLQSAIDAATEGQTVTIVSDLALTEGVTVAADKNLFIALNGNTITGTPAEAKAYAVITNKGTLTIQGEGAIVCNHTLAGSTSYAVNTIVNSGYLTIDGATIENKSTASNQIGYAIDNNSTSADAVVTIVSGNVTASGSNYYDGIRQFANSTTKENDVIVRGGKVSSIWMQNPSDGSSRNTKDVIGSVTIEGGEVTALYLEPSANFEAAITAGHVGNVSYFETAANRDLVQFVTGGTFGTFISEEFLAYGYQLTGEAAPYTVEWTGKRDAVTFIDGQFTEYVNENDIEVGTLTYKRNFSTVWTPFYVPFEIPVNQLAEQGLEVAYINSVRREDSDRNGEADDFKMEVIYIHGGNADGSAKTLKANYPYFVRAKEGVVAMNVVLTDAMLYAAAEVTYDCTTMTEKFEITGNTRKMTSDEFVAGDYIVSADGWQSIAAGSYLNPFRLYMTVTSRENSEPVTTIVTMSIAVRGEELADGTTVIYDVEVDDAQDVDYIYDLQGRRVLEPQKGNLYIINGKKVIF